MAKLLVESKRYSVVAKGNDYSRALAEILSHRRGWNKIISEVCPEKSVVFVLVGNRKTSIAHVDDNVFELRIQLSTMSNLPEHVPPLIILHELAHKASPSMRRWNGRRDVHGWHFKAAYHKLVALAHDEGVIDTECLNNARVAQGASIKIKSSDRLQPQPESIHRPYVANAFRVGDRVTWYHNGHKHGGVWEGTVVKVNRRTYKIDNCTQGGQNVAGRWSISKADRGVKLVSAE